MTLGRILILRKEGFCAKAEKRRLADYSTSEMVKLCGMKASSTFENKRDKVFERYEIDPTLFKMDSSIEGGENFYPVVCAELLAILIKNWDKNPSSRKNANRDNVTVTQICDFYRALLKDVDDLPKELRGLIYKSCQSHFTVVEVNQVIMLRPTQSPIVFIQQLGRGLRKAENKEYVVILDFIGNYNNNFMIPVALSGDRTYNADTIRKYVISGNNTIPGVSTVHFDEIAKEKIFNSIDKIRGMKSIIRESYISLKNRIGRIPLLYDFYEQGEIDPLVIIKEYKTYWQFLEAVETGKDSCKLNDQEKLILKYLSKTILSGVRPSELCILKEFLDKDTISTNDVRRELEYEYDYFITDQEVEESVKVLQGHFVSKDDEYQKYKFMNILRPDGERTMRSVEAYQRCLRNEEFNAQIRDIIKVGLARYKDKYTKGKSEDTPLVLYEKYSRRDVSLLMNCGKDLSSTMYGMSRIGDDVFIFITYHKEEAEEGKNYADGKPDYADAFEDNLIFKWDSQIGKDNRSPYMQKVLTAPRKHLLVKKSDAETSFYYMGQFDIVESADSQKEDNNGKMKPIAKVTMKMHHPVREDLLRYLQSNISKENEAV